MKIILASNNKNKLLELRRLTEGMGIELVSQGEAGYDLDVEETGSTFEENAYLKARAVTELSGLPAVADDSGIEVAALGGGPGIYSARFGPGHAATDSERNEYLLKLMEGVEDRSARFVCCICGTFPNGDALRCRGECLGEIEYAQTGSNGFGYDAVFKPLGYDRGMGELSPQEKNAISHRGKAVREYITKLREYMNETDK